MAEKTLIMLAKNVTDKSLAFPLYVSEKIDGIAVSIMKMGGVVLNLSRQNKPINSIDHIMESIAEKLNDGDKIVGELFIPGMDFKDSGGVIRRQAPDLRIKLGIYDHVMAGDARKNSFETRYIESSNEMEIYRPAIGWLSLKPYMWLYQERVVVKDDLWLTELKIKEASAQPTFEGWMYRSIAHQFQPGKRSWGMQRRTMKGSIDLRVVSVEQAFSADGEPKGMVGRINVWYPHKSEKGKQKDTIGVGPGRLTHDQRTRIWELYVKEENDKKLVNEGDFNAHEVWGVEGKQVQTFVGKIIEIEHKIDPSYAALRQPTYQALRRDKDVGDNE